MSHSSLLSAPSQAGGDLHHGGGIHELLGEGLDVALMAEQLVVVTVISLVNLPFSLDRHPQLASGATGIT